MDVILSRNNFVCIYQTYIFDTIVACLDLYLLCLCRQYQVVAMNVLFRNKLFMRRKV